jgi:hypothetical protein
VEEFLPLLGGYTGEGFSSQWMDASKSRVYPQYIEVEMQSWSYDGFSFDPRSFGVVGAALLGSNHRGQAETIQQD